MKIDKNTDIRQKVIDEALAGDLTLYNKLGKDLGVKPEEIGSTVFEYEVSLIVDIQKLLDLGIDIEAIRKVYAKSLEQNIGYLYESLYEDLLQLEIDFTGGSADVVENMNIIHDPIVKDVTE